MLKSQLILDLVLCDILKKIDSISHGGHCLVNKVSCRQEEYLTSVINLFTVI